MPDFTMPSLGADMDSGVLVEWLVKSGDTVHRGDPIAVVDTDKAAIEVESFHDGVVGSLLVEPGARVEVGGVMARIEGGDMSGSGSMAASPPQQTAAPVSAVLIAGGPAGVAGAGPRAKASPPVRHHAAELGVDLAQVGGTGPDGRIRREDVDAAAARDVRRRRVSPYARRLAEELGVDLTAVGSGDAPVSADDVRKAAAAGGSARARRTHPEPPQTGEPLTAVEEARVRPGGTVLSMPPRASRRGAVAHLMSRSKREIPHYYVASTVDLDALTSWLRRTNRDRSVSERIVPAAGILRATALAAREMPQLNGFWVDGAMVPAEDVHLGVAVSVRDGALVAPAIRHAADLSLPELMHALRDLVSRARSGRLTRAEMADPTLTVTDLGDQGVEEVIGVIYPPQVALVGVGRILERPWAVDGMLAVHPVVRLTLSGDHRATDGSVGARFLSTMNRLLQHPEEL